jgi:prepilin-type N-terminal cleavage/methylation domain-containing protein
MFYIFGFFLYNVSLNMKHNFSFKNRISLGFTLIELLVVIAIIGILSSVVLTSMRNSKTKAINANIQSSLSQLATVAGDIDNLQQGGDGNGNCNTLFANPEMQKLVNYAAEQAGREVVYTYCSKSSADYLFTFIAPKVGDDGIYYCVDQHVGIKEVSYGNINSILSGYDCGALVQNEDSGESNGSQGGGDDNIVRPPLTIISAVYDGGSLTVTFNQNVHYAENVESPVEPITISDVNGISYDNNGNHYQGNPNGSNSMTFPVSSPILCEVSDTPWGTYSQSTHYVSVNNIYGVESLNVGSMSVTITCPAPVVSCVNGSNSQTYYGCMNSNGGGSQSCSSYSALCDWNEYQNYCYQNGQVFTSCEGANQYSQCPQISGCYWDDSGPYPGVCAGTPTYSSCGDANGDENVCRSIYGCDWGTGQTTGGPSGSCGLSSRSCADYAGNNCPTNNGVCSIHWQ